MIKTALCAVALKDLYAIIIVDLLVDNVESAALPASTFLDWEKNG